MANNTGAKLNHADAAAFILAGKAVFTVVSTATGARYTFRVKAAEVKPGQKSASFWFVNLLTGPDNTSSYTYLGVIGSDKKFKLTAKSKMAEDSAPVKAFRFVLAGLLTNTLHGVEFWHAGHCGRCGKQLTVPSSVACGFGPECVQLVYGKVAA